VERLAFHRDWFSHMGDRILDQVINTTASMSVFSL
jgi:hypothetical protein